MKILRTIIKPLGTRETEIMNFGQSEVTMTIADADTIEEANNYVTFRVQIEHKEVPLLGEVQEEALARAKSLIAEERKPLLPRTQQAR